MHSLYLQAHWSVLRPAIERSFPLLTSVDLHSSPAGSQAFVTRLAAAHDLTSAETSEMLDDVVMHALGTGAVQTSDVTHRMVASS